jgi:phospholipase/carboxylesterase
LLHGLGSDELDLYAIATQLDTRVFAISARAPNAYQWGGYMWYDLAEGPGLGGAGIQGSLDLLRSFLDEIVERYPVDAQRLFVGGFSMGAAMAGALALLEPERVRGAAMISGYLPPPAPQHPYRPEAAAGHPIFQSHGTLDRVIPLQYARHTRDYLQSTQIDLTYREYPIGHEVSLEELRDLEAWIERQVLGERDSVSR